MKIPPAMSEKSLSAILSPLSSARDSSTHLHSRDPATPATLPGLSSLGSTHTRCTVPPSSAIPWTRGYGVVNLTIRTPSHIHTPVVDSGGGFRPYGSYQ